MGRKENKMGREENEKRKWGEENELQNEKEGNGKRKRVRKWEK